MTNFLDVPKKSNILRGGLIFFALIALGSIVLFANFSANEGDNTIWVLFGFAAIAAVAYAIVWNIFKRTPAYSDHPSTLAKVLRQLDSILQILLFVAIAIYSIFGFYNQPGATFISIILYKLVLLLGSPITTSIIIAAIIVLELFVAKRTLRNRSFLLIWCILLSASIILFPFINSNFGLTH